ncbi:hypothetical protein [Bacillus pumilus]|uniref:hypothetical protein n=1 Tax=Bacillus pumilus TaxID=1408 RepID=UPI0034D76291
MNNIVKGGENILDKAIKHMESYLQVKNNILDNDYVQLIGDSSRVVGFLHNSSKLIHKKKFQSFLKGFSMDEDPTQAQLEKLIEYVDDETKAEFVADVFSKILFSNSSKACVIMGSILNDVVERKNELTHEQLNSIHALMHFYDIDIENYRKLFSIFKNAKRNNSTQYQLNRKIKMENLNRVSINMTLEKAITNQLFYRYISVDVDLDVDFESADADTDEYFKLTRSGHLIGKYIDRIYTRFNMT